MSLVNEMLKDLDQRQSQGGGQQDLEWLTLQSGGDKPAVRSWRGVALLLVVMAAVGIGWWLIPLVMPSDSPVLPMTASDKVIHSVASGEESQAQSLSQTEATKDAMPPSQTVSNAEPAPARAETPVAQRSNVQQAVEKQAVEQPLAGESTDGVIDLFATKPASTQAKPVATTPVAIKRPIPLTPAQRDRKLARESQSELRGGDYRRVIKQLQAFVAEQPQASVESGELLLGLLLQSGDLHEVETWLARLERAQPEDYRWPSYRARLLLQQGDAERALALLRQHAPELELASSYYELMAVAAQRAGQLELAQQTYLQMTRFDPSRGDWWVGLAVVLEAQGKLESARVAFERALRLSSTRTDLRRYAETRLGLRAES